MNVASDFLPDICFNQEFILCRLLSQTPRPTKEPTSLPSSIPSNVPSSQSSSEPSLDPSKSAHPSSATDNSLPPSMSSAPSSSSGPSLSPSKSVQPSGEPSMKASFRPSDEPSSQPSSQPSSMPSDKPSSEPSLQPSSMPSDEPSTVPSKSSIPSTEPSSDPSLTPSKSIRPSPSQAPPRFKILFDGTFTIATGTSNAPDQLLAVSNFLNILTVHIESTACPADSNAIFDCEIKITTVNGVKVEDLARNRLLRSRRSLVTLGDLVIAYQILLQAICSDSACTDAYTVGTELYTKATDDLKGALQDGSFVADVKADLSATTEVNAILDAANLSWDFDDLIIPLLAIANFWYPDWHSGEIRCKNDGNAPNYMTLGGWWHETSEEECCKKYFLWAYDVCTGGTAEYLDGYYPAWEASEPRCDTGDPPNYMRGNPKGWLSDTPEDCCRRFFGWATTCVVNSGGTAVADPTASLYYADWSETNTCVNDGNAPGYVKSSPKIWMYDTLAECCKANYFWGDEYSKCVYPDGNIPAPTEELWYVDWNEGICVTSCVGSKPCGGLHKSWNVVYSTKAKCCEQHLWWKKDCMRL